MLLYEPMRLCGGGASSLDVLQENSVKLEFSSQPQQPRLYKDTKTKTKAYG